MGQIRRKTRIRRRTRGSEQQRGTEAMKARGEGAKEDEETATRTGISEDASGGRRWWSGSRKGGGR